MTDLLAALAQADLVLCRHGAFERRRESSGRVQERLTASGLQEARALAAALEAAGVRDPRPLVLYASPQPRALATGQVLAERLEVTLHADEELRELRLGLGAAVPETRSTQCWARARSSPLEAAGEGAETFAALQTRALATLRGALRANPGRRVIAITHGGLLEAVHAGFLGHALGEPGAASAVIATGACSAWAFGDGGPRPLALNVRPVPAGV
jgi:probable phosphoglycerate mutase